METVLGISILLRAAAAVWATILLLRQRDWRMVFLPLVFGLMAWRQALTLQTHVGAGWDLLRSEWPGLIVSLSGLGAVIFLGRLLAEDRRVTSALIAAEAKFVDLYENAPDMFVSVEAATARIVQCNKMLAETLGYAKEEILGRRMLELYHPDAHAAAQAAFEQFARTGSVQDAELQLQRKDGSKLDVSLNVSAMHDASGRVLYSRSILRDITQSKRAEEDLKQSKARFSLIFQHSPVGIALFRSQDGHCVEINDSFLAMTGHGREEILGHTHAEVGLNLDPGQEHELQQSGILRNQDLRFRDVSGTVRDLLVSFETALLNREPHLLVRAVDVTERRQVEAALRESEARLRLALAAGKMGTWDWDLETNRIVWAGEHESLWGMETGSFRGTYAEFEARLHPDDRAPLHRAVQEALANHTPFNHEYRVLWPDGSVHWILGRGQAMYDDHGKSVRMIGTVMDVSIRREAEELKARMGRILETLVNEIYVFDSDTLRFLEVNESARRNLGYSLDELRELTPLDLKSEFPRRQFEAQLESLRRGEHSMVTFETVHRRKDGSIYPVEVRLQLSRYGSRTVFFAIVLDTSLRREAESALRALNQKLQHVREEERAGIARELHDQLGQELTGLKMDIAWLSRSATRNPAAGWEAMAEKLAEMAQRIDGTLQVVRRISSELRPGVLDELGLCAAIEWQAEEFQRRSGIACDVSSPEECLELSATASTAVFRIFQELLTNVARHAKAKQVWVRVQRTPELFQLEVQDDGRGVSPRELDDVGSLGLLGMQERAGMIGAHLHLEGVSGEGTTATLTLPMPKEELAAPS